MFKKTPCLLIYGAMENLIFSQAKIVNIESDSLNAPNLEISPKPVVHSVGY